jgi:hypothetical protein
VNKVLFMNDLYDINFQYISKFCKIRIWYITCARWTTCEGGPL